VRGRLADVGGFYIITRGGSAMNMNALPLMQTEKAAQSRFHVDTVD
jgi:hypothetical protein